MDLFSYIAENPERCLQALKRNRDMEDSGKVQVGGRIFSSQHLDKAITDLDNLSGASKRAVLRDGQGQPEKVALMRAIIMAEYRPVVPLRMHEGTGDPDRTDHLPAREEVARLGHLEVVDMKWSGLLEAALNAELPWRQGVTLGALLRQVARVDRQGFRHGPVGTAWPLWTGDGCYWITNRHVVAPDYPVWHYQLENQIWKALDPGTINRFALAPEENKDVGIRPNFHLVSVVPKSGPDLAALQVVAPSNGSTIHAHVAQENITAQAAPIIPGLEMVWNPLEMLANRSDGNKPGWLKQCLSGRLVLAVGHPTVPRAEEEQSAKLIFDFTKLGLKHLMPGRLQSSPLGTYGDQQLEVLRHDCSTLKGASGSCILDLGPPDTDFSKPSQLPPTFGKVIGVHFHGVPDILNAAVPTWHLPQVL